MQLQWSAFVVCARRVRDEGDVADAFALRSAAFVRACCLPARRVCVATMGAPAVLVPTGAGQQTNQAPHVVSACLLIKGHGLMAARDHVAHWAASTEQGGCGEDVSDRIKNWVGAVLEKT